MFTSLPVKLGCLIVATLVSSAPSRGQTTPDRAPAASFEVASVRPSSPLGPAETAGGGVRVGMRVTAGEVEFRLSSLSALIATAFGVRRSQVVGPVWLSTTMYDIVAKLPDGATADQVPQMLQVLLADRFRIAIHRETAEQSAFALIMTGGTSRLKAAAPSPGDGGGVAAAGEIIVDTPDGPVRTSAGRGGGSHVAGRDVEATTGTRNGAMFIDATRITMKTLAQMLSPYAGGPVQDKTGIAGAYQITIEFTPDRRSLIPGLDGATSASPSAGTVLAGTVAEVQEPPGGSLAAALARYGIGLVPEKVREQRIVVDHIERTPTEN